MYKNQIEKKMRASASEAQLKMNPPVKKIRGLSPIEKFLSIDKYQRENKYGIISVSSFFIFIQLSSYLSVNLIYSYFITFLS